MGQYRPVFQRMGVRPPKWSQQLTTIGITGTNGKTSTTRWTAACLAQVAQPVVQVTTLGAFLDDLEIDAAPDFDGFVATMRAGLDRGARFAAIELTSQALARGFARRGPARSESSRTSLTTTSTRTARPSTTLRAKRSS